MRIVFLGTPDFAVPSLNALANSGHKVVLVVSQPDREKDRKGNLLPTKVKQACAQLNLECYQPEKISSEEGVAKLISAKPDIMVTAAYGQLLSVKVLNVAPLGVFNVHASLLPSYRGSSPIQASLLNGDTLTGVTIMKTQATMDTGDIYFTKKVVIEDNDNLLSLTEKIKFAGAEVLVEALDKIQNGEIKPIVQDDTKATYCKKINKIDGLANFCEFTASELNNRIRAFNPWPCVYSFYGGKNIKFYCAEVVNQDNCKYECGQVAFVDKNQLIIKCKSNTFLSIKSLQLEGKKVMDIEEFLRGNRISIGESFKGE